MRAEDHKTVDCSVTKCDGYAEFWVELNPEHTFYLCDKHKMELADIDGEYYSKITESKTIQKYEIGEYACADDCPVCWS